MERLKTFKTFITEGEDYLYGPGSESNAATAAKIKMSKSGLRHIFPGNSVVQWFKDKMYWNDGPLKKIAALHTGMTTSGFANTIRQLISTGQSPSSRDYRSQVINNNRRLALAEAKNTRSPLYVFDFDNTIANTNSGVIIKDKRTGSSRRLTSAEYAKYKPRKHEEADFSEFGKVINPRGIVEIQRIMGNMAKKGRPYTILTARPQQSSRSILRYIRSQGLHVPGVRVIGLGTSDPKAKANYLRGILQKGKTTHLEFFDDHGENVHHVSRLTGEFPNINIRARHITYGERHE
jgi:hypothetical protein